MIGCYFERLSEKNVFSIISLLELLQPFKIDVSNVCIE